jgi:hypothetical protein
MDRVTLTDRHRQVLTICSAACTTTATVAAGFHEAPNRFQLWMSSVAVVTSFLPLALLWRSRTDAPPQHYMRLTAVELRGAKTPNPSPLRKKSVVLGAPGAGKSTLAINFVGQLLRAA